MTDKIQEIQLSLAECLYYWACQTPLNKEDTLALINYLREDGSVNADNTISDIALCLLMALLYSIDVRALEQEESDGMHYVVI